MFVLPWPAIDPVAFSLGPAKIHWYGISYVAGILLGWRYCIMLVNRLKWPFIKRDIDDFIPFATLGIVAGGRLGHALLYNPGYYFDHPLEVLHIWQPGMSFHGGLLGVILALLWFVRKRQIPLMAFGDILACAAPIGLFFGRIANFINGELYGRMTDVSWAMIFPGGGPFPRHPSQLYEAMLEGILLFLLLFYGAVVARFPERYRGAQAGLFLSGYGISRMLVECFREPDVHIGYLTGGTTWGQWLSMPLVFLGMGIIYKSLRQSQGNLR